MFNISEIQNEYLNVHRAYGYYDHSKQSVIGPLLRSHHGNIFILTLQDGHSFLTKFACTNGEQWDEYVFPSFWNPIY